MNTKDQGQLHRSHLRARLLKAGRQAFADHKLLELILTYAIPRIATKQSEKRLLEGVLNYCEERK